MFYRNAGVGATHSGATDEHGLALTQDKSPGFTNSPQPGEKTTRTIIEFDLLISNIWMLLWIFECVGIDFQFVDGAIRNLQRVVN